jgi:hypothetical protein
MNKTHRINIWISVLVISGKAELQLRDPMCAVGRYSADPIMETVSHNGRKVPQLLLVLTTQART